MNDEINNAQVIADLAVVGGQTRQIADGVPFITLPEGYKALDLEHLLPRPVQKRGTFVAHDAASFVAYVNKHKTTGTIVTAQVDATSFKAVLDHHDDEPGWGAHKVSYGCPKSPEWAIWTRNDNRQMTQSEFAQFLEENLPDIIDPSGADVLTVVQTLEANTKVKFSSAIRLDNGQRQLTYEEVIEGAAAKGTMKIPEIFTLAIPPFRGSDRYKVEARLRYRIPNGGGQLSLWYELVRPEKVVEAVFQDELVSIRDGRSPEAAGIGLPILLGSL